ncbi:uncharacterized protein C14orf93 homolog [Hippoglossus hippoglossus]|uniref:uncharacterized protein C14orf93 homolog n=1 Tax=Hippoglossus hippoglossus TaxID=8267 RepID=UPI00148DAF56|nr:uncharacterized protein C14orf93 homolog [Hippoglossus hippoglossus]
MAGAMNRSNGKIKKRYALFLYEIRSLSDLFLSYCFHRVSSRHNESVTAHLVDALAESPDLRSVRTDVIVSACKTYFGTIRRKFRYSQPDLEALGAALKSSARSRQRRKRLLGARKSVLVPDDAEFWRGTTIDMMSDEEDGSSDGSSEGLSVH